MCAETVQHFLPSSVVDLSWEEYRTSVYGPGSNVTKSDINLLYRNGPVSVKPKGWSLKRPLYSLSSSWGETYFRYSDKFYRNYEWAEVNRYSTKYLQSFKTSKEEWVEGLSVGFPGRSKKNSTKVSYGCWFNIARGSGIYVNVGRSLVTNDKYKSSLFKDLGLTSKGCLQSDGTGEKCYDRYVCTAALHLGYNSVQVTGRSEIVLCGGNCATKELRLTCPPVPMRCGTQAQYPCNCSDNSVLLNCGANSSTLKIYRAMTEITEESEDNKNDEEQKDIGGENTEKETDASTVTRMLHQSGSKSLVTYRHRHHLCVPIDSAGPGSESFEITILFTANVIKDAGKRLPDISRALQREQSLAADPFLLDASFQVAGPNASRAKPNSTKHSSGSGNIYVRKSASNNKAWAAMDRAGYKALGADYTTQALGKAGPLLPDADSRGSSSGSLRFAPAALSLSMEKFERSKVFAVRSNSTASNSNSNSSGRVLEDADSGTGNAAAVGGFVQVGVISFSYVDSLLTDMDEPYIVRRLIDEATCLRSFGAEMVVLMSGGDNTWKQRLTRDLAGYVDVVLGLQGRGAAAHTLTCEGLWHTPIAVSPPAREEGGAGGLPTGSGINSNSNNNSVQAVLLQIDESGSHIGVLHVHKNKHGISYQSNRLTVIE
jgi:hypothetical protein